MLPDYIHSFTKISGSAFQDNGLQNTRPQSIVNTANYYRCSSLTDWCSKNYISKRTGRKLLSLRLLIGFRRHHIWWVAANPECMEQLLEYLGVDSLLFDPNLE